MVPISFSRLFGTSGRRAIDSIVPRRTFDDVILPPSTRRALDNALAQVTQHDLIFRRWGLGERHSTGLALAFNFAGPPGTGKTICAEAIAHSLGRHLLMVRYAELESMWMGETPKNVAAIFRTAREEEAVLFFDEADAIAARRSTSVDHGFQRESNSVVSVLLQELETYSGVVIFATNLAANFDPAFERRIRTHVLFEMPGETERAKIWQVQLHPLRTPLAADVDFNALSLRYEVSGGDIQNAVLKAALAAAAEPIPDASKTNFKLADAQELVARQMGFDRWQALISGADAMSDAPKQTTSRPILTSVEAQLFVANVQSSCEFYTSKLGFAVAIVYGDPPFYGQVVRDCARLNLRLVGEPVFSGDIRKREGLLSASITVATASEIKQLFLDCQAEGQRQPIYGCQARRDGD